MRYIKRALALALLALVLLVTIAEAALPGDVPLKLPDALKVIDEASFMNSRGFSRAVLPEGVTTIQSKAFANSALSEINLPDTLQFIAEDAFSGSKLSIVAAKKGSYAHNWALSHGYLKPLTLSVSASAATAAVRDTVTWTPTAAGGRGPYQYTFRLYCGDKLVETAPPAAEFYSHTFIQTGEYTLLAVATDANGDSVEVRSAPLTVTLGLPEVAELTPPESTETIQACTWTATAQGGTAPYAYKFVLKRGTSTVYTRDFAAKNTLYYTFFDTGSYTVTVTVRDAKGNVGPSTTQSFKVTASNAAISGVVRIYVDIDKNGNILRGYDNPGHYELQINNSGNFQLAFDDRLYTNPAFSYSSDGFGFGVVSVSDGDQILKPMSRLYTFSFNTTAAKLKSFLYSKLQSILDTKNETESKPWRAVYSVTSGSFSTYQINTTNCFTAVASWCSTLGYGTLTGIARSSSSYLDYLAWKMLDKYGANWHYVGMKK